MIFLFIPLIVLIHLPSVLIYFNGSTMPLLANKNNLQSLLLEHLVYVAAVVKSREKNFNNLRYYK